MQKNILWRAVIIAVLMLSLLIPLSMIRSVVGEREDRQSQVERTIAQSFAGPQRLTGPILVVPYVVREFITTTDEKGRSSKQMLEHDRVAHFLPERLTYDGTVAVEPRYKGLYKTRIFQIKGIWRAEFLVPAHMGLAVDPALLRPGRAYLAMGVSDARGLRGAPIVQWAGQPLEVANGTRFDALGDGLSADIGELDASSAKRYQTTVELALGGTGTLSVAPLARGTAVQLRADWPHPNFAGQFLPTVRQVDADGFTAKWEISHLASHNGAFMKKTANDRLALETFDVSFIEPVNIYQRAERAVKYGILFIALTFAAFFLFETLKRLRIHPLQYVFVGLALALFFLLLISLSEHLSFALAYVIAACSCVLLITYYLVHVLDGWKRGLAFGTKLAVLYAVLYGLLLSEDNALMLGSLLLFASLAVVMILTRKTNWYQLGSAEPSA